MRKLPKITIRNQHVFDAKRFFNIFQSSDFAFLPIKVDSVEEERRFLKKNKSKRKRNFEYNFTILSDNIVVGAVGVKINQHYPHIGEIGYFVEEQYWGKEIAPKAVKLIETFAFNKLKLIRLEILINTKNKASIRVAEKSGYKKESVLKARLPQDNSFQDAILFSKVRI